MNRRLQIIKLTRLFQFFTQSNYITASHVKYLIDEWVNGNDEPILELINDPELPMLYFSTVQKIQEIISETQQ